MSESASKSPSRSSEVKLKNIKCALGINSVPDILSAIHNAIDNSFSYLVCPVIHPRLERENLLKNMNHQKLPMTRNDLTLSAQCWQNYVVARSSRYYECDSENEDVRKNAMLNLTQELKFVAHLNITIFMIELRNSKIENLAAMINQFLCNKLAQFHIFFRLPIQKKIRNVTIENEADVDNDKLEETGNTPWHWWKKLRTMCEESNKLGVALEITADLPSDSCIERWMSEPIKLVVVPTSLFLTNKNGFPVLSKVHQTLVHKLFSLGPDFLITGACRHPDKGIKKYYEYMNYLYKQYQQRLEYSARFTKGYEDCLQNPLQPLMDNLENQVYEVFEKDPVKYSQYQKAIAQALQDRVKDDETEDKVTVIMVVGAGRGPLVRCALEAALETKRKVKLYAVEKNPNAINTLLNLKRSVWGDSVEVIFEDMREWKAPEKADILVSELLGSFGDNELSPECLDGAQTFLKDDGISIPYRYRSFIAPVQSYRIYNEVKTCKEYEHPYEAPYVVLLNNHCRIDEEKLLFEFHHPNRKVPIDNNRYQSVDFTAKYDATIHGIGGYFDSHLFKDVDISITPSTHSKGMFSWFPMFFPLKDPMNVRKGDKITIHFWRWVTARKVHYEWSISLPQASVIHNPNGRTYWIGL